MLSSVCFGNLQVFANNSYSTLVFNSHMIGYLQGKAGNRARDTPSSLSCMLGKWFHSGVCGPDSPALIHRVLSQQRRFDALGSSILERDLFLHAGWWVAERVSTSSELRWIWVLFRKWLPGWGYWRPGGSGGRRLPRGTVLKDRGEVCFLAPQNRGKCIPEAKPTNQSWKLTFLLGEGDASLRHQLSWAFKYGDSKS